VVSWGVVVVGGGCGVDCVHPTDTYRELGDRRSPRHALGQVVRPRRVRDLPVGWAVLLPVGCVVEGGGAGVVVAVAGGGGVRGGGGVVLASVRGGSFRCRVVEGWCGAVGAGGVGVGAGAG